MSAQRRFWQSTTWRKALLPDSGMAEAEGLAAGTGLLTGEVARHSHVASATCPICDATAEVVVIDLVAKQTSRSCPACGHRWTADEPAVAQRPRR